MIWNVSQYKIRDMCLNAFIFLKDYPVDTKPLTRKISDSVFIKLTSEIIAFTYLKKHIFEENTHYNKNSKYKIP